MPKSWLMTICGDCWVAQQACSYPFFSFSPPNTHLAALPTRFPFFSFSFLYISFSLSFSSNFPAFCITTEEEDRSVFFALWHQPTCPCLLQGAFCRKWSPHTITGITLLSPRTAFRSQTLSLYRRICSAERKGIAYECKSWRHKQHLAWVMLICFDGMSGLSWEEREQKNGALLQRSE